MNPHPRAQLSAYLDEALAAAERTAVAAHLDVCADCRARLSELRATASLIGALPDPIPTRRLAPRLTTVPVWLAPFRTLTTLASGISVFLFIASAVLAGLPAASSAVPTSLQAPAAGGAAASTAERNVLGPGSAPNAPSATSASGAADSAKLASGPSPTPAAFSANQSAPNPAPPVNAQADQSRGQAEHATPAAPQLGPSPLVWLALAIAFGAMAFAVQRRLRSL